MSLKKKFASLCCAFTLAASMVPVAALAGEEENGPNDGEEVVLQWEPVEFTAETSASVLNQISLFSLDSKGAPVLRNGEYAKYVDRIDLPAYALEFNTALEEAVDGDKVADYLIDEKYFKAETPSEGLFYQKENQRRMIAIRAECDSFDDLSSLMAEAMTYASVVMAAFDRDHPEVFWLSGGCRLGADGLYNSQTKKWTARAYLVLAGDVEEEGNVVYYDTRLNKYKTSQSIYDGIDSREAAIKTILDGVPQGASQEGIVRHFNDWLTRNNEYNTDLSAAKNNGYSDAWECLSALEGRDGLQGPVCEGYARAFKVLCDRAKVDCTLVDGEATNSTGHSEAHMWNYAKIGNAWYAVDVTWNDPTGSAGGKVSGSEDDKWLLVGGTTMVGNSPFLTSHPVANKVYDDLPGFTNGPILSARSYAERLVLPSMTRITATYGDSLRAVPVPSGTVTKGDTTAAVDGSWSWEKGSTVLKTLGDTTYHALFTPADRISETVAVPFTVNPKTISVVPGTVANKIYNGNTDAFFSKAPTLSGVLSGDDVNLTATAKFVNASVGNGKQVKIAYKLNGKDAGNYMLASSSATATANITAVAAAPKPSAPSSGASASGSSTASKPSSTASSVTAVKAPVLKKLAKPTVKSSKKKQLTVTWKKGATVTWNKVKYAPKAYVVQYSTDAKFKKGVKKATVKVTKALAKKSKLTTTLKKGLVSKKTYYVRVAAQYKIGGKTYTSPYAVSKKVKVK